MFKSFDNSKTILGNPVRSAPFGRRAVKSILKVGRVSETPLRDSSGQTPIEVILADVVRYLFRNRNGNERALRRHKFSNRLGELSRWLRRPESETTSKSICMEPRTSLSEVDLSIVMAAGDN